MQDVILAIVLLFVLWLLIRLYSVKVYRFYRPGCGYCKTSQDEWDKFKSKCMVRMVRCIDINMDVASSDEQELADNCDVKTVPTIIRIYPNGKRDEYKGDRTADAYTKWMYEA